jgi:hypothetical protein
MGDNLAQRVRAGVKLLDTMVDARWAADINLDQFDIESQDSCILGQLFGDYDEGLHHLALQNGTPHGFYANDRDEEFTLTRMWRYVIRARQAWFPGSRTGEAA